MTDDNNARRRQSDPKMLRERAVRMRRYARQYGSDDTRRQLEYLASQLENRAREMECNPGRHNSEIQKRTQDWIGGGLPGSTNPYRSTCVAGFRLRMWDKPVR